MTYYHSSERPWVAASAAVLLAGSAFLALSACGSQAGRSRGGGGCPDMRNRCFRATAWDGMRTQSQWTCSQLPPRVVATTKSPTRNSINDDVLEALRVNRGRTGLLASVTASLYSRSGEPVLAALLDVLRAGPGPNRIEALRALRGLTDSDKFPFIEVVQLGDSDLSEAELWNWSVLLHIISGSKSGLQLHCSALRAQLGPRGLSQVIFGLSHCRRDPQEEMQAALCLRDAFLAAGPMLKRQILREIAYPVYDGSRYQQLTLLAAEEGGDEALRDFAREIRMSGGAEE